MSKSKILYISSEITPFVESTEVAKFLNQLSRVVQETMEIRILIPRFGIVNERRNRLHEVKRLSGINISLGETDKQLTIKVASIPNAKLQVYFIDNKDFFYRKSLYYNAEKNFHEDNHERLMFFCRGALETIKKLGWSPNIIHCFGWMSSLIPLYVRTIFKDELIFQNSKMIFSLANASFEDKFNHALITKHKLYDIDESLLNHLHSLNYEGLIKTGMDNADKVITSHDDYSPTLQSLIETINHKVERIGLGEEFIHQYLKLYEEI